MIIMMMKIIFQKKNKNLKKMIYFPLYKIIKFKLRKLQLKIKMGKKIIVLIMKIVNCFNIQIKFLKFNRKKQKSSEKTIWVFY